MSQRGYSVQPIGCIEIEDDELCTYYYFEVDRRLVELEVIYSPVTDSFTRTITAVQECAEDRQDELMAS